MKLENACEGKRNKVPFVISAGTAEKGYRKRMRERTRGWFAASEKRRSKPARKEPGCFAFFGCVYNTGEPADTNSLCFVVRVLIFGRECAIT
jgi:hypothetical protein